MMISCQDVCEKASDHLEGEVTLSERLSLRLHLLICKGCRTFFRQFQNTVGLSAHLAEQKEPTDAEIDSLVQRLSEANPD